MYASFFFNKATHVIASNKPRLYSCNAPAVLAACSAARLSISTCARSDLPAPARAILARVCPLTIAVDSRRRWTFGCGYAVVQQVLCDWTPMRQAVSDAPSRSAS